MSVVGSSALLQLVDVQFMDSPPSYTPPTAEGFGLLAVSVYCKPAPVPLICQTTPVLGWVSEPPTVPPFCRSAQVFELESVQLPEMSAQFAGPGPGGGTEFRKFEYGGGLYPPPFPSLRKLSV